jgi:hypothetical protein
LGEFASGVANIHTSKVWEDDFREYVCGSYDIFHTQCGDKYILYMLENQPQAAT